MANKKIKKANSRYSANKDSQAGVAKPSRKGKNSKAPPGNAGSSANPENKGGLNVLKKVKKNGAFKSAN